LLLNKLYCKKLALVCWQSPQKIIIINDDRFANVARKGFACIWDRTEMPSHKNIEKVNAVKQASELSF
jgi:hypothetical protein